MSIRDSNVAPGSDNQLDNVMLQFILTLAAGGGSA